MTSKSVSQLASLNQLQAWITKTIPTPTQGILLALVSNCLFVFVGLLVKLLSERIDVFQILLFRQLVFITFLLPAISASLPALLKPKLLNWHILRITGAFIALYLGFVTVSNLSLTDATALGFTNVLFVVVISRFVLAETVDIKRITTVCIGFIGVMLVVQPSFNDATLLYTLTGLGSALGAATAIICVRKMANTESRVAILAYQAVFVGLLALIPSLFVWQWPSFNELMLLLLVGSISSVAQWIGVTAYKFGEANIIANVEYAKIIYSLLFGYFMLAEIPNTMAIIGVSIIIFSAFVPFFLQRIKRK